MAGGSTGIRMHHPDGQVFTFDAGALCLEFVFTGGEGFRARYELFTRPEDVARWAAGSRLDPVGHGVDPDEIRTTPAEFRALWRLREALWTLAAAAAMDGPGPDATMSVAEAVAAVNELAARPGPVPQLADGRVTWRRPVTGTQLGAEIARDAVRTFAEPTRGRIRKCGAGNCFLIYLDTSRPGRRRWCSMQRCGNRHKVNEFRHRHTEET